MFKKVIIYFFVAIFLSSIFPSNSEAVRYKKNNFEITFPDQCNNIWDFTNGITARNDNYIITVWLPTPLDYEQQKICNGKTEHIQLDSVELTLLADHLATMRKSPLNSTTILQTFVANIPPLKLPAVYYIVKRDDNSQIKILEVQIISKGTSYSLTFASKPDSFDKYKKEIFTPTIASFTINN